MQHQIILKFLDNKFLYYFLLSKLDVISSFYRGSGIKHPSMYHVLEMLIPIPPTLRPNRNRKNFGRIDSTYQRAYQRAYTTPETI